MLQNLSKKQWFLWCLLVEWKDFKCKKTVRYRGVNHEANHRLFQFKFIYMLYVPFQKKRCNDTKYLDIFYIQLNADYLHVWPKYNTFSYFILVCVMHLIPYCFSLKFISNYTKLRCLRRLVLFLFVI